VLDGALALGLAGVAVAEIWVPFTSVMGEGPRQLSTVVSVLTCLGLMFRRVWPLLTAVVVISTWPIIFLIDPILVLFWGQFVPMVVALYSVARHAHGRRVFVGAVVGGATLLVFDLRVEVLQSPGELIFHWMVFTIAWCVGYGLRLMERRAQESMQRAIDIEVASAERTMAAIVDERTRIARELHDVVAHSMSMMVVQAGAAEQVVDDDPTYTRKALETIRATGTDALAEMRRVVAMLRDDDETGERAPQPGMDGLPTLVEEARTGGLDAALVVEGQSRTLPVGLDLAVYRIIQEALTNVRRHASASTVSVALRYGPDSLELEVRDDGAGTDPSAEVAGHGLIGMRERAALYGGRLETATEVGAGFTVRATLPVATA